MLNYLKAKLSILKLCIFSKTTNLTRWLEESQDSLLPYLLCLLNNSLRSFRTILQLEQAYKAV